MRARAGRNVAADRRAVRVEIDRVNTAADYRRIVADRRVVDIDGAVRRANTAAVTVRVRVVRDDRAVLEEDRRIQLPNDSRAADRIRYARIVQNEVRPFAQLDSRAVALRYVERVER